MHEFGIWPHSSVCVTCTCAWAWAWACVNGKSTLIPSGWANNRNQHSSLNKLNLKVVHQQQLKWSYSLETVVCPAFHNSQQMKHVQMYWILNVWKESPLHVGQQFNSTPFVPKQTAIARSETSIFHFILHNKKLCINHISEWSDFLEGNCSYLAIGNESLQNELRLNKTQRIFVTVPSFS